jgi:hypothetical protein
MTDAALTACYAAAEPVEKLLNEIELPSTSTNSYNVDAGAKWIRGMETDSRNSTCREAAATTTVLMIGLITQSAS